MGLLATRCMQHTEAGSCDGSALCACLWLEGVLRSYFVMSFLCHYIVNNMISCPLPWDTLVCVCRLVHFQNISRPLPLLEAWLSPRSITTKTISITARPFLTSVHEKMSEKVRAVVQIVLVLLLLGLSQASCNEGGD